MVEPIGKSIIKEGWLLKQSRYLKSLRKRWCVLDAQKLCTYKSEKVYTDPTEAIGWKDLQKVMPDEKDELTMILQTSKGKFPLKAESKNEKEEWTFTFNVIIICFFAPQSVILEAELFTEVVSGSEWKKAEYSLTRDKLCISNEDGEEETFPTSDFASVAEVAESTSSKLRGVRIGLTSGKVHGFLCNNILEAHKWLLAIRICIAFRTFKGQH